MAKKEVTIEDLALMVKRGFDETIALTAKQKDLDLVKADVEDIKERVENIERLLLKQHTFQIQELAKRVRRLEDLFLWQKTPPLAAGMNASP